MNKFRHFPIASVLAIAFLTPAAFAQTPVNISIISGNGQISCPQCTQVGQGLPGFDPLQVRVTDANGNPVPYATVTWTVVLGGQFSNNNGYFLNTGQGVQTTTTTTDVNGNTNIQFVQPPPFGSGSLSDPYISGTIAASIVNGATVTFYETEALIGGGLPVLIFVNDLSPTSLSPCPTCLNPGDTLTGTAGSTSSFQFKVQAYVPGGSVSAVPNVSLRLISNQSSPTVSCASQAGADPGSVLTDQTGTATCVMIFGSSQGSGSFYALVGGVAMSLAAGTPLGFWSSYPYGLVVTPGVPGMISLSSGNNQGANPGQTLVSPLIATVADASGNPLSGAPVTWSVSPSGAATLSSTATTSNSSGQVQTNVTLASSASGTVQVTVALSNSPNISATFTVNANTQVSGLAILTGNSQSAVVGASFAPLVVQLSTSSGTALANIPVSFNVTSGSATLSSSSATTNSSGQAQVNVTAGSTPGPITVTAAAGAYSVTFDLTVIQQGPTLTAGSFYNGADFQQGSLSPCSIATIIAPGIAPSIQGVVAYDGVGALSYLLAGDSVTFSGSAQAPIWNVANVNGQQQVTFQVPCTVTPGNVPVTVSVNGASATVTVPILPASPGLFSTQVTTTTTIPVLERPDGSFVSTTNPAHRGETLIAYVTGLGPTSPAVATNSLPAPGSTATVLGTVIAGINGNGATLLTASLAPDIIGVYEVAFEVPSSVQSGANAGFSIGIIPQGSTTVVYYSTLGTFPVQ